MKQIYHIVEAKQLADKELLSELFEQAKKFSRSARSGAARQNSLSGKILATLFYEPSTRTRFSFEAAMLKLGGQVITAADAAASSSAKKGESLEDTIRIVAGYADCIVLRHPENGAALRAAEASKVPVINAGDGSGAHPTQALLDLYTIQKELGTIDGLRIAFVGDLTYGRTVHSLVQLLDLYDNMRFYFVAPEQLALPTEYKSELRGNMQEMQDLQSVLPHADVVYMTRIQKERIPLIESNLLTSEVNKFSFGEEELALLKKDAIIMHPLPRVNEIDATIDADPRAAYFRQAHNGLFVRMALLHTLLA